MSPKNQTIRCRIVVERDWSEDRSVVMRNWEGSGMTELGMWWVQVAEEFNEACPNEDGSSIVEREDDAHIKFAGVKSLIAYFTVNLEFTIPWDPSKGIVEIIQEVFYDVGGVAGDFHMVGNVNPGPKIG